ncbi:hypothetical protein [Chryseobacterium sp. PET-29]|uniref:hypothetical protein n=1 Tax=Chryseobacterium sp. PET-29 TaxID=2983267 RepID=UPI0021E578F0|nr:hypothetical protein [Chryseobacterium sp. PET-29]
MCCKDFIHIQLIRRKDNSFYRTVMYYKIFTPVQKNYTYTNSTDYEAIKSVIYSMGQMFVTGEYVN